jgi:hypothetical protein
MRHETEQTNKRKQTKNTQKVQLWMQFFVIGLIKLNSVWKGFQTLLKDPGFRFTKIMTLSDKCVLY